MEKKLTKKRLSLSGETLRQLDRLHLAQGDVKGAGLTLTFEGSCDNSYCPCPTQFN